MGLPVSQNEQERLKALHALQLLDTPPSAIFDRITKLASVIFNSEISVIALLDERRQWFLSRQGLEVAMTRREDAFCSVTIAQECMLDVPDTERDERFADNPLVTGEPFIRSYIGCPVQSPDGHLIGTIAVIDSHPDKFAGVSRDKLLVLAGVVEDLLHAHQQAIAMTEMAERERAKHDALEKANRIFVAAEKAACIGSWEIDLATMELTWSEGVYQMHGIPIGQPISVEDAINAYAPEDREHVAALVDTAIAKGEPFEFEACLNDQHGANRRVQSRGECLKGNAQHPDRLVGVIHDITENHRAKTALQRAADYDRLTDLLNRNAFDRILGEKIKQQSATGQSLAVLLVDLDGFKAINDTFGHLVGDMVLEEISARLRRTVPEDVVIARWGGDEFVFIPPLGSTHNEIEALWETLTDAIRKPFVISGRKLVLHGTGGAEICSEVIGGREIVRRADLAMYSGKKRASGTLRFYDVAHAQQHTEKLQAVADVRDAIQGQRLFAAYQPIVDLLTDEVVGLEALMRMKTREGDVLHASNVMPAIIDPHVSREIGERMVANICHDQHKIRCDMGALDYVSLNASEADLLSQNFAPSLLNQLAEAKVDPASLAIEVTETMLMVNDDDAARRVLSDLKKAGMQIALDDFGTGFSSLTHLRDFPIYIVKIDRSFVRAISSDHQSRLIVQAMIAMAQSLEIKVVAEGIETQRERELLAYMGCQFGQGYLLGEPQTCDQLQMSDASPIAPFHSLNSVRSNVGQTSV
ncbi:MAG: EAL domain-containing protein [Pseudomonadota bacterium]